LTDIIQLPNPEELTQSSETGVRCGGN